MNNETDPAKDKLLIVICGGTSAQGGLVTRAAQELVLEGRAEWVSQEIFGKLQTEKRKDEDDFRLIVVDGCSKTCGQSCFENTCYHPEFHLSLEDIGISEDMEEFGADELQLVKDAIISVSTRVSPAIPMIPGCCC